MNKKEYKDWLLPRLKKAVQPFETLERYEKDVVLLAIMDGEWWAIKIEKADE